MAKIAIEVGHGGTDAGAVAGGFLEKNLNLTTALELKRQLERHGQTVLISRTTDVDDRALNFLPKAKAFAPDVGVSVHYNAGHGSGFEVFYQNAAALSVKSKGLCTAIEAQVVNLGMFTRGLKPSPFRMSDGLSCPYAYLEGGFMDTPADLAKFDTADKQKAFGTAYAKGILSFLGMSWKDELPPPIKTLYQVVSGSYYDKSNAERWQAKLKTSSFDSFLKAETVKDKTLYRVVSGSYYDKNNATAWQTNLKQKGFDSFLIAENKK